MRLLITGGGTGGHVYPLLAVLQSLVAAHELELSTEVRYVGRGGSIEERLAAQQRIRFTPLQVGGLRSAAPWTLARNLVLMARAAGEAGRVLKEFKPHSVLATGGYVSAPAVYAAARQGIPVVIYLPDLEPGLAIRTLSRWARCVAVSFQESLSQFPKGKAVLTGYPVREGFLKATPAEGRAHFQLASEQNVATIFGGSTGAHSINEAVRTNLDELLELAQVIHICGKQDEPILQAARAARPETQAARYHLYSYLDQDMPLALAAADVVVARAGAATLGEFPAVGVPSVLVPYPFAGRHQERNAGFMVSHGAAVKLDDAQLDLMLMPTLRDLFGDREKLEQLAAGARELSHPDAAAKIAELLK